MMTTIRQWLLTIFPKRRLMPSDVDLKDAEQLYYRVFGTPAGREMIELWIEQIMFNNPRTTDASECITFAVKCAFVEDIVKALDRAENPGKYERMAQAPGFKFEPRRVA